MRLPFIRRKKGEGLPQNESLKSQRVKKQRVVEKTPDQRRIERVEAYEKRLSSLERRRRSL